MHRISVFTDADGNDFHFHRENSNGSWSDKQGFSGAPKFLPIPYSFDYDPGYKNFCGELCVND